MAAHLENFAILFSYNSGKIENREITYHDTHEIFKNGRVCGYTGDLRTLYEIKNLKDASELMYRWFDERKPISLDSIREMQFELTKGTYDERRWELGERPGKFKKNDLWGVGMHDVAAPVDEILMRFPSLEIKIRWWQLHFGTRGLRAFMLLQMGTAGLAGR